MTHSPQLILTLGSDENLQVELPGANGRRCVIKLTGPSDDVIYYLTQMLREQKNNPDAKIGEMAFPTQAQWDHLTEHTSSREHCPFCALGLQHSKNQCNEKEEIKRFDHRGK